MPDPIPLHPANPDEITQTLAFALQFDGRRRTHKGDEIMARIVAERLVRHLYRCGFIIMKKPPVAAPTTSGMAPVSRSGDGS
jgi:hypothetical protein